MTRRLLDWLRPRRSASQPIIICGYCGPASHTTANCPHKTLG